MRIVGADAMTARSFEEAVTAFCEWAERPSSDPVSEAFAARRLVAEIYSLALLLPEGSPEDDDERPSASERDVVFRRFGALPFNYYSVMDPLDAPPGDPMVGDLADDLIDIWQDLKVGLRLLQTGRLEEARCEWRWSFDSHWGQLAASALYVLQSWVRDWSLEQTTS